MSERALDRGSVAAGGGLVPDRSELATGLAAVIHRYTGEPKLVVEVSDARASERIPFDLSRDPTFAELRDAAAATIGQDSSSDDLQLEVRIDGRHGNDEPLVRLRLNGGDIGSGLVVEERSDALHPATVERLDSHVRTLVNAGLIDSQQRVDDLPLLGPDEERLIGTWNSVRAPYPDRCLHELIAEQTARAPDAIAVVGEDGTLTYGELDARANRLAHHLAARGVGPESLVAICTDRTARMLVAILATLKAGGAYVPLDPTYPPERLGFMVEDANAEVVITQSELVDRLPESSAAIVLLDRDRAEIERCSSDPIAARHSPKQLAYVIYTSGSTGRPKGAEIEHRSAVCFVTHMLEQPGLEPSDVVLNLTTPAFDPSVMDFFWPLLRGARVVILPREDTLDGERLAARLDCSGATFAWATPTSWRMVLDAGWEGSERLTIAVAGEALPRALADALLSRGKALWHMYGPTEATVYSSVLRLGPGVEPPPIGGPSPNEQFHVLDPRGRRVPIGVPGQLHIGGDGVGRGYRSRPDLTEERFLPDPFTAEPGGRLYDTGDLVRWRPDGTLDFMGRSDHQVKIRGFRVELGEIESVLCEQAGVRNAAVVVFGDDSGGRRLVAYVASGGTPLSVGVLRRRCAERLPSYMVPSAFVLLDSLPLNPNRKLDRAALPAPDRGRPDLETPFLAPATPLERVVAEIWGEVLDLEQVGVDDDFFELGGDSIVATQIVARLTKTLGVEIPLRSMFDEPTVGALAAAALVAMSASLEEAEGEITS